MRPNLPVIVALSLALPGLGSCAQSGTTQEGADLSVSRKMEDAAITARLKTTYLFNRHLDALRINVDTKDGAVALEGVVRDDIQKDLAGAIAEGADGVKTVRNDLRVGEGAVEEPDEVDRTFTQTVRDATTTATVKASLAVAKGVKASEIDVSTRWGTVTLAGTVATKAEKELALKTAEDVAGVKDVVNNIQVGG